LVDFMQKLFINAFLVNWVILGSQKLNFSFFNKRLHQSLFCYIIKPLSTSLLSFKLNTLSFFIINVVTTYFILLTFLVFI